MSLVLTPTFAHSAHGTTFVEYSCGTIFKFKEGKESFVCTRTREVSKDAKIKKMIWCPILNRLVVLYTDNTVFAKNPDLRRRSGKIVSTVRDVQNIEIASAGCFAIVYPHSVAFYRASGNGLKKYQEIGKHPNTVFIATGLATRPHVYYNRENNVVRIVKRDLTTGNECDVLVYLPPLGEWSETDDACPFQFVAYANKKLYVIRGYRMNVLDILTSEWMPSINLAELKPDTINYVNIRGECIAFGMHAKGDVREYVYAMYLKDLTKLIAEGEKKVLLAWHESSSKIQSLRVKGDALEVYTFDGENFRHFKCQDSRKEIGELEQESYEGTPVRVISAKKLRLMVPDDHIVEFHNDGKVFERTNETTTYETIPCTRCSRDEQSGKMILVKDDEVVFYGTVDSSSQ